MTYSDDTKSQDDRLRNRLILHGRYVPSEDSARPMLQSTIDVLTTPAANPVTAQVMQQPTVAPESAPKKSLFSSIINASVQVEKVTRQSVQTVKHSFEPPELSALRTHRQKLLMRAFYGVGSLSFVFALILGVNAITHTGNSGPVTSKSVLGAQTANPNDASRTSAHPSENKPTSEDIATYLVAPVYPRYLKIKSIGVDTRIRRLGLDSRGAISTPNNINDAGWYDASVKPGEKEGASIIEGHVAGPTKHGVFWDLNKLTYGDVIEVIKGSGELVKYKVSKLENVPADQVDMKKYLTPEVRGRHDLKLITAAGKYNIVTGVYDTRLVVYAEQI